MTGEESLAVTLVRWKHRILAIAVDVTMRLAQTPVIGIAAVRDARCLAGSVHDRHFYGSGAAVWTPR